MRARLAEQGVAPVDVTDVLVSHAHFDHVDNWPVFSNARITIGREELAWALAEPWGDLVSEISVQQLAQLSRTNRAADGDEVFPHVTAHLTPGHTPGHLTFVLHGSDRDVIFTGDAAKNRAELTGRIADRTYDAAVSTRSIGTIWSWWTKRPETLLVPGHDIPMTQKDGACVYLGPRVASVNAWYGDDIDTTTVIDLAR